MYLNEILNANFVQFWSNDNFVQNDMVKFLENKIMKVIKVSAAYLKLSFHY